MKKKREQADKLKIKTMELTKVDEAIIQRLDEKNIKEKKKNVWKKKSSIWKKNLKMQKL